MSPERSVTYVSERTKGPARTDGHKKGKVEPVRGFSADKKIAAKRRQPKIADPIFGVSPDKKRILIGRIPEPTVVVVADFPAGSSNEKRALRQDRSSYPR